MWVRFFGFLLGWWASILYIINKKNMPLLVNPSSNTRILDDIFRTCEICGSTAKNVAGAGEIELVEHSSETSSNIAAPRQPTETRSFWQGHRFLNFLLACMIFAFVISWLFHFNVPGWSLECSTTWSTLDLFFLLESTMIAGIRQRDVFGRRYQFMHLKSAVSSDETLRRC